MSSGLPQKCGKFSSDEEVCVEGEQILHFSPIAVHHSFQKWLYFTCINLCVRTEVQQRLIKSIIWSFLIALKEQMQAWTTGQSFSQASHFPNYNLAEKANKRRVKLVCFTPLSSGGSMPLSSTNTWTDPVTRLKENPIWFLSLSGG